MVYVFVCSDEDTKITMLLESLEAEKLIWQILKKYFKKIFILQNCKHANINF